MNKPDPAADLLETAAMPPLAPGYTDYVNASVDDLTREASQHAGQLVARSHDGTSTFAYADAYPELFAALTKQGIDPCDVTIDRVRDPEVDEMP